MRNAFRIAASTAVLLGAITPVAGQEKSSQPRGELLYTTFCVACHTTQMHWRDKRIARDMQDLKTQVRRWQDNIGQKWDAQDIDEVSNYLNRTFYKFPGGTDKG